MSKGQKFFLTTGLLLMAVSALFPPRGYFGPEDVFRPRGFLYRREFSDKPCAIDLQKLVVEWMFLAAATGALMMMAKNRPDETQETGHGESSADQQSA